MLALKQSQDLTSLKPPTFNPNDVSNLELFLKFNQKITADEDSTGGALSPEHSTALNTMDTGDRINLWKDQTSNANDATQTTSADKPSWNVFNLAPAAEPNSVAFDGSQYMDLDSSVSISANQDFTIVTQVLFENVTAKAIYGSDASNFFRINDATGFRCKIGGAPNNNFTEASDTIVVDKWFTVVFSRINGATGDLRLYVDGQAYEDKAWGSTSLTDADAFTINNIGSAADDTNNLDGVLRNVLIYKKALTATERKNLYIYLNSLIPTSSN
jgi:hypothetical protein